MEALRANRPVVSERAHHHAGAATVRWVRVYGHPVWDAAPQPARGHLRGGAGRHRPPEGRGRARGAHPRARGEERRARAVHLHRVARSQEPARSPIRGFLSFVERDALAGQRGAAQGGHRPDRRRGREDAAAAQRAARALAHRAHGEPARGRLLRLPGPRGRGPRRGAGSPGAASRWCIADGLPTVWGDHERLRGGRAEPPRQRREVHGRTEPRPRVEIGTRQDAGERGLLRAGQRRRHRRRLPREGVRALREAGPATARARAWASRS